MTCQATQGEIPQDVCAFLWESDDDRNGHTATFGVKFGKKKQLFDTLDPGCVSCGRQRPRYH